MIFVEFQSSNKPYPGAKHHFIGTDLKSILRDTEEGKGFGKIRFESYREITELEIRQLGIEHVDEAIAYISRAYKASFKLKLAPGVTEYSFRGIINDPLPQYYM